ncbi:MAG: hypothetical protein KAT68_06385, partial [Bacteroidales bacterium]|nr:hypothetical protein [Bacteroidales bacterium]
NFVAQMGGPTFYDLYTEINGHWISNKKLKEMIVLTSTNKKIKKIIADLFNSIYGQTKYDNSLTAGPGGQNGGDSMNPKGTTKGFTSNKFELLDPNTGGVLPQSGRWDIVYFENTVAIVNGGVYDDINRTLTIYREIFEMSKTAGNYMMENAVFDVNKMYFKYYYSDPYGGMQYSYGYYYRENGIDNGVKWNGISY